jgi:hypothetical protein
MRDLSATSLAGGLALIVVGVLLVLDAADELHLGLGWLAPLLIAAVGFVLVVSGAAAQPRGARRAADDRGPAPNVHRPLTPDALLPEYRLAAGRLVVDLTALTLPAGVTEVKVHVDLGEATVLVPAGASVLATARAAVGTASALGEQHGGFGVTARRDERTDGPRLIVEAGAACGQVTIARGA